MAGYNWARGKSNNAVRAEDDGLLVASKLAQWAKQWRRYAGCTARDVADALDPAEWHHSSKYFNKVNYYDRGDLAALDVRRRLAWVIRRRKLVAKLIRLHGRDGKFAVMALHRDGRIVLWHHAEARDVNGSCSDIYLARMIQTVDRGYATSSAVEQAATLAAAGKPAEIEE